MTETETVGMGPTSRIALGGFVRRESFPAARAPGGAYTPAGSVTGTGIVRVGSMRAARSVQVVNYRLLEIWSRVFFKLSSLFNIGNQQIEKRKTV